MRLSYIELKNYRRFRSLKLQMPDGVIGILGLNGVGKTTIIEAVAWAMFGNVDEVVRIGKDSIRRTGASPSEDCAVTLEFELGGTEYRVKREMGGKNLAVRAVLQTGDKTLAEDDKPVRKMMEHLVGMDHKSFFTSVFARQKELNALQNVAPGERKKVVLRMLRIDSLDTVLTEIRSDKRESMAKIEGAEKTLLLDDGREREKVVRESIPELERVSVQADGSLEESLEKEKLATQATEKTRARRDELKKDVDAYISTIGELREKQSALDERKKREVSISRRISEADVRLQNLPVLEKEESEWTAVNALKDRLEKEKTRAEKARMMKQELASEESDEIRRLDEVSKIREGLGSAQVLLEKIDDTEKARTECQTSRAEISGHVGELRAKAKEKREERSKDLKKLEEIRSAGRDGTCPTCERKLDESYELLIKKLEENTREAERVEKEAFSTIEKLEGELRALTCKEDALRKRRGTIDKEMEKLKQLEASIESRERELAQVRAKIAQRKKTLLDLGEIRFSEDEYVRSSEEFVRLKKSHDQYVELKSLKNQTEHYTRDLDEVRSSIKKVSGEIDKLTQIIRQLEPNKVEYESVLKDLDQKMELLNSAKDLVRKWKMTSERAHMDLDRARKDLDEIAKVKQRISEDRRRADELALLEEIFANFKDHLMGRIAPALSELASKELESMTEGRYTKVELSDDYEMKIDDQGIAYPIDRFSGGESDLANLSLRLAISRIIAERTGANPINFLILDEIFGSQDPNRKRSVMAALSRLSGQFRQIILITHIEDVKDSMNYVIRVEESEDGTSRAELAA